MSAPFEKYLERVELARVLGNATEHTYRQFVSQLFSDLAEECIAVNEPKRSECGAPDFVVLHKKSRLTRGYIEAKDIGVSLDDAAKSEQLTRYFRSLHNLILTDYLEFRWYVEGKLRQTIRLAQALPSGKLGRDADSYEAARHFFLQFLGQPPEKLQSAEDLAKRLARLTHLVRDVIIGAFRSGNSSQTLLEWRSAFANTLMPELAESGKEVEFADMFAQTLAYGLFSARVMSEGAGKFTREVAQKLIPPTNEFLRRFFYLITGPELDSEPFAPFVEDIVQTLDHTAMEVILEDFGQRRDPIVHFYETFLAAYDPKLREVRGVYYTPEPVVGYIVRSVDWILRDRFGFKDGIADSEKFTHTNEDGTTEECHRVLVLDPATGTATFLYEVIKFIREQFEKKKNRGQWDNYVRHHLIPRIFGFELLMASYAVAHFKLGLQLFARDLGPLFQNDWAYHFQPHERLNIYLTNTLEDMHRAVELVGPGRFLSDEANKADDVKRRKPVLVVMGNPPYANFGQMNQGTWILGLLDEYKRGLKERKLNLNDDFIKFIRWAQWRIELTGQGVIGFITNNVYLDGLTHRRMRESLLETFDEIYIVNLHGSAKKKETCPDGSRDENVFDIMVGTAIVLLVKLPPGKGKDTSKRKLGVLRYTDVWGTRKAKYERLRGEAADVTDWKRLKPSKPRFAFVPTGDGDEAEYRKHWLLPEIFVVKNNGIKTDRDPLFFEFEKKILEKRMRQFFDPECDLAFLRKFNVKNSSGYDIADRRKRFGFSQSALRQCLYRPFDTRWLYYDIGLTSRPAEKVMKQMLAGDNLALVTTRQTKETFSAVAIDGLAGHKSVAGYDINTVFPLYLYPSVELDETDSLILREEPPRRANLAPKFIAEMSAKLGMKFTGDGPGDLKKTFGPEDIFHYAYAVFHSPGYRTRYAEFLRMDFPRLPLTENVPLFRKLAAHGAALTALHLLREDGPDAPNYPAQGTDMVEDLRYVAPGEELPVNTEGKAKRGRVYINAHQYFDGVPPEAWAFPIGGYLPAQKWLKDRKGRALSYEDQTHYPCIIAALAETGRRMQAIDKDIESAGGWPLK